MSFERLAKLNIILSATDKMSRTINNAFGMAGKAFGTASERAKLLGDRANAVAATTGAVGIALLAPLGLAAEKAIEFEESMADVSKVMNLVQGSKALNKIGNDAKDLAVYLAKPPKEVASLYAELAQGGAAKNQLNQIAKKAGQMAVAFDIDPGQAGERFMKLQNAMGLTTSKAIQVADSINHLSDKTAAKAGEILDFLASGAAGASRALGLTGQEVSAIGSLYISAGKSGSEASTIFERMTKTLRNQNKEAGKIYAKSGGGLPGLMAAIQKGASLSGKKRFEFFSDFGEYGTEVEQLANNFGKLQQHLGYVANAQSYANSVQNEFNNRANTTAFRLKQAQSNAEAFAIEIGTSLLPAITDILKSVTPMIKAASTWARQNPVLAGTIAKVAAVLGVAMIAISAAAKAVALFNVVLYANPIVWVIAGIAALAAAVYLIYKNWGPISEFFGKIWTGIKFAMGEAWKSLKTVASNFYNAGKNLVMMIAKGIWDFITFPIRAIKKVAERIREYLPFSPAKVGPLTDLHRVKISQTIASAITPSPINAAMNNAMSPIASMAIAGQGSGGGGYSSGTGVVINFSPIVNMVNGSKEGVMNGLKSFESEIYRIVKEAMRKEERIKY